MRTKTLLLTAAALLTAGIVSTQAQGPVYSQNVVGYASVPTPNSGTYYSLSVPFAIGASNGANEIFGSNLPDFSLLLLWDSTAQAYNTVQSWTGSSTGWADTSYGEVPAPIIPVGQGFFLNLTGPVTNVFSGAVAVNVGTSNNLVLPNSGTYYFVAPTVPYAGSVTNGDNTGGGLNLNGMPDFSLVLTWDPVAQAYVTVQSWSGSSTGWADTSYGEVPPPTLTVGQGFFVNLTGPYTWTTGLKP